jgi:positive regulator of sigma E activity
VCHGAPLPAAAVRTATPLRAGQEVRIRMAEGDLIAIGTVVDSSASWMIRIDTVLAIQDEGG